MGRSPCCDESGLKKGPWTPEEDQKLINHIKKHGHGSWRALPRLAGLNRCGKSCRLRWTNYLRPDIKRGKFSPEEEQTILNLHSVLGNKWSTIATHLPGRTDNEIKNYWNTHLKKKLIQMGFDPMTHRPRTDIFSSLPHLIALANLKELMDHHSWEQQAVRLQNEVAQMAKLQCLQYLFQQQTPPSSSSSMASSLNANTINTIPDMDTINLLNSLPAMKDHTIIPTTSLDQTINDHSTFQAMHHHHHDDSVPFSHMPELQAPCSFEISPNADNVQPANFIVLSHGENSPSSSSPWLPSSGLSPSPPPAPPSMAEPSANIGGASSSAWPDLLLEDQLFHEIL